MSNSSRESGYYRPPVKETPHPEDSSLVITFLGQRVELWKFLPSSKRVRSLSDLAHSIAHKLQMSASTYDAVHGLDIALQKSGLAATWSEGGYTIHSIRSGGNDRKQQSSSAIPIAKYLQASEIPPLFIKPSKLAEIPPEESKKRKVRTSASGTRKRAYSNRKSIDLSSIRSNGILALSRK